VVAAEGNIVSLIQSIFLALGSGVAVTNTASTAYRAGLFTLDPGHPHALAGGKRPFPHHHSGYMEKGSRTWASGSWAGSTRRQAHAQFVSNLAATA